jgi:hypothetical protein
MTNHAVVPVLTPYTQWDFRYAEHAQVAGIPQQAYLETLPVTKI